MRQATVLEDLRARIARIEGVGSGVVPGRQAEGIKIKPRNFR